MCHGGASEKTRQYTVWNKQDAHARAYATLTTARASRLADVLKIGDAAKSVRCTSCHAPLATLKAEDMMNPLRATEGVSCESCHGAAENWVRAHTRADYSHANRVQAGLRDLSHQYVRANSCVACHENLERELVAAGHPELIFEMDGQAVSQPKHWHEKGEFSGPQAWLTGQAVALREMSWQLASEKTPDDRLTSRWHGLHWLLQIVGEVDKSIMTLDKTAAANVQGFSQTQAAADKMARAVAEMSWTEKETKTCLSKLARTAAAFRDGRVSKAVHARRGERLVLAIDRLTASLDKSSTATFEPEVQKLFKLAQSLPEFDPTSFANALDALAKKL
jgi:hypothetical protein